MLAVAAQLSPGVFAQENGEGQPAPALDIVLVLDNSGSMKTNDPQRMTRKVVTDFMGGLSGDARIALIIFADRPDLALPLAPVGEAGTKQKAAEVLGQLNYSGQYTNSPAAIERAIYELKNNGRKDAQKLIIFMTDGIVDTGDKAGDAEKQRWLKEELADEAKGAEIRIFGIAFTEQADYALIQILGQKTGGGYYRALKTDDIQGVFSQIRQAILSPRPAAEAAPVVGQPQAAGDGFNGVWIVAIVGLIVLGLVVFVMVNRKPVGKEGFSSSGAKDDPTLGPVPQALVEDTGGVTKQAEYQITKRVTSIGRLDSNEANQNLDISIPKNTISGLHATIEYQGGAFYLIDQASTNGTFLNGRRITGETRLKSGDEIAFDRFKFRFTLPGQPERGKTVLMPYKQGGTVVSGGEPDQAEIPEQSPEMENNKKSAQAQPGQLQKVTPSVPKTSDDPETSLKPEACEYHPTFKATELCSVCKKGYCSNCIQDKDGRKICKRCLEKEAK
jgi:pSer/pThr/pTyr-binding forkhead associated (FHA) protein/Mg-chelatase subunit ChlD